MPDTLEDPRATTGFDGSHDNLPEVNLPSDKELGEMVYGDAPVYMGNEEGDPDLSKMESGNGGTGGTGDYSFYDNDSEQEPPSNIKSKFKGLGSKKRWALLSLGSTSLLAVAAGLISAVILLLSFSQLGAVARVLEDVNFIFVKRTTRTLTRRAIFNAVNPASKYKINTKGLSKLKLMDQLNPNNSLVKFDGEPSLRTGRPKNLSLGESTIDLPNDVTINTPLGRSKRLNVLSKIDDAILEVPELGRLGPLARNRRALELAESIGYKFSAWDKGKRFFQGIRDEKGLKKAIGQYLSDKYRLVEKARIKFGSNDLNSAAQDAEDAIKNVDYGASDLAASSTEASTVKATVNQLTKAGQGLSKFAGGIKGLSLAAEAIGYYCLFYDLSKLISGGKLERSYSFVRTGMNILTSYHQAMAGDTSPFAIGMAVRDLGDFQSTTAWAASVYQKPSSTLSRQGYLGPPSTDQLVTKNSIVQNIISALGSVPSFLDGIVSEACNALTSPLVVAAVAGTEIVVQLCIAFCTFTAGTPVVAGDQAAIQGIRATGQVVAKELAGEAVEGLTKTLAVKVAGEVTEEVAEQVVKKSLLTTLRGVFGKMSTGYSKTKQYVKMLAKAGTVMGGTLLLQKAAAAGSALDTGCVGGYDQCMNIANIGLNSASNIQMSAKGGRPSSRSELSEVKETLYEEILLANKQKSFANRLLSFSNPRSPLSLMASSIYIHPSTLEKVQSYAIDIPNLIFNPFMVSGFGSKLADVIDIRNTALASQINNDDSGYHVWFYSKAEEKKLVEDPSFDPDANAEYVEANLESFEEKYGKCYKDDEIKMETDNSGSIEECSELLKSDDALHYRVYKADNNFKQYLEDVASATNESNGGTSTQATPFSGDQTQDTSAMQCPQGTSDLGINQIKRSDKSFSIRICKIPSPSGGSGIYGVNVSIAENVLKLVNNAHTDGVELNGSSFRTNQEQIKLRKSHCGTSNYDIYEKPSGNCSPPTARPGNSKHELALAIDFSNNGGSISSGSKEFNWLRNNASKYGLYNLPSESWHWSVDGK